jgi:hypothetical protein
MMTVDELSDLLLERARDEHDIEAARLLRKFKRSHDVAREVVMANTHQGSKAAYAELVDLMKGKAE